MSLSPQVRWNVVAWLWVVLPVWVFHLPVSGFQSSQVLAQAHLYFPLLGDSLTVKLLLMRLLRKRY